MNIGLTHGELNNQEKENEDEEKLHLDAQNLGEKLEEEGKLRMKSSRLKSSMVELTRVEEDERFYDVFDVDSA